MEEEGKHMKVSKDEEIEMLKGILVEKGVEIELWKGRCETEEKKNGRLLGNGEKNKEKEGDDKNGIKKQWELKNRIGEGSYREEKSREMGQGRRRFCHFWNNGRCQFSDEDCMFLHRESPECKHGYRCSMRRCMFYHPRREDWNVDLSNRWSNFWNVSSLWPGGNLYDGRGMNKDRMQGKNNVGKRFEKTYGWEASKNIRVEM